MKESKGTEKLFYPLEHPWHCIFYFLAAVHLGHGQSTNFITCHEQRQPQSGLCYVTWTSYNGTYQQAQDHCQKLDGNLPRVPNAQTMQFIKDYSKLSTYYAQSSEYKTFWIGLRDEGNNGVFTWWNSTELGSYNLWASPPTLGTCALYNAQLDRWQAASCYSNHYFICEFIAASCETLEGYSTPGLLVLSSTLATSIKTLAFGCAEGYTHDRGTFWWQCTTINYDNVHIPDNANLPVCRARTCNVYVDHGTMTKILTNSPITVGETGDVVVLSCDVGFNVTNGTEQMVLCNTTNGWTDTPLCIPHECNLTMVWELYMPANMSDFTGEMGAVSGYDIVPNCDNGYSLTWDPDLPRPMVCDENGNWTNIPSCQPNLCSALSFANGELVTDPVDAVKQTGVPFTVTCDAAYILVGSDDTTRYLECDPMGLFAHIQLECQPMMCDPATLTVANVFQSNWPSFTGDMYDITCQPGYNLTAALEPALCTPAWSNKPTCEALQCGELAVTNGTVAPSAAAPTGTVVTVTCDLGYTLSVPDPTFSTVCGPDESWANAQACVPNNCTNPTFPFMATVAFPSGYARSGHTPEVTCAEGYELDAGSLSIAVCHSNGTWLNPPACLANSCATLSVASGTLSQATGLRSGDVITLTCGAGYYFPTGPSTTVLCDPNGVWIRPVSCVGYSCNATAISNVASLLFIPLPPRTGSMPDVTCQTGYTLSPQGTLPPAACTSGGAWTNKPTCIANNCSLSEVQSVLQGSVSFSSYPVMSGMTPVITCNQFHRTTVTPVVCLESGLWKDKPECRLGDCSELIVSDSLSTPQMGVFGGTGQVVCEDPYRPSTGDGTVTCQTDHTWSPNVTCIPNPCTQALTVDNSASVVFQDNMAQTGNGFSVTCSPGFDLTGVSVSPELRCLRDGTWDNKPTCRRQMCPTPGIRNGHSVGAGRQFGDTVTVICFDPYTMTKGSGTMTCSSDRSWVPEHECTVNACETLTIPNGVVSPNTSVTSDVSVMVTCNPGFVEDGFDKTKPYPVECYRNGTWFNRPKCSSNTSGSPCKPHGIDNVRTSPLQPIRNVQTLFTCAEGYQRSGPEQVMCDVSDGSWGTLPTCTAIDSACEPHGVPSVMTSPPQPIRNEQTMFSCATGYRIEGPSQVTCAIADGSWGTLPTCIAYPCSALSIPQGAVTITGAVTGAAVTIQCKPGYTESSTQFTPTCNSLGQWAEQPSCLPNTCSAWAVANGNAIGVTVRSGSSPSLTCTAGYIPLLTVPVLCGPTGAWLTTRQCQSCGSCLTNYNNAFPQELKEFSTILTHQALVNHCSILQQYETCFRRPECSGTVPTNDNVWTRENLVLSFVCSTDNLQDINVTEPCLRTTLDEEVSSQSCRDNLQDMTADTASICSAPDSYFACLSDKVIDSSTCDDNLKTRAKNWLDGFTANLNTVPDAWCTASGGAPYPGLLVLCLSLLTAALIGRGTF